MADLNVVMINGRLTADAELRFISEGTPVCNITIASNRRRKKGGEWIEEALFIGTALWGKRAEALAPYLTKGRKVAVKGELAMESWQSAEGQKRTRLVLALESIEFLDGSGDRNKERVESVQQVLGEMSEEKKEKDGDDIPF